MSSFTIPQAAIMQAQRQWELLDAALGAFRAECTRKDRMSQEREADRAMDALREYLDQLMIAYGN